MIIEIVDDATQAAQRVATLMVEQLKRKADSVLGLATGGTMEPVYMALRHAYTQGAVSFAQVVTFNLDEYIGLAPEHPCSYRYYMNELFFKHIDIDLANTHLPKGNSPDPDQAAWDYEQQLQQLGPIDLQLLGIGKNGHIGFNEPMSSLGSRTRTKGLTHETRQANQRYFDSFDSTPTDAITMGIQSIMEAKYCLLLATGEGKKEAIKAACEGSISAICPASMLQFHPKTTVVVDKAAASLLEYAPHYSFR